MIARRAGKTWYIAGINADTTLRKVKLDLKALGIAGKGTLITNGIDPLGFESSAFPQEQGATAGDIDVRGRGGFVLTLQ